MDSPVEPLSLPSAQVAEEMARFTMPSAFKMVGCMASDDTTPPSSPDGRLSSPAKSPSSTRFNFSRLVTKHPESSKPVKKLRRSRPLHQQNATDAGHKTPDRLVVSRIETPYPLIFPESPVSMDSDRESCQLPQLELRRVSSSYGDLRAAAQVQENLLSLPSRSHPQTPLLPSPIIDDRVPKDATTPRSYFAIEKETPFAAKRKDRTYKSYEDLHILSCYGDRYNMSPEDSSRSDGHTEVISIKDVDSPNYNSYGVSTASRQGSVVSSSSSINSPESGWLANTTSHNERQERFKERCYQVVQHSRQHAKPAQESNDGIMLATVLVGRRKPKIVQIQRPPSSNNSVRSKGSISTRQTGSPQNLGTLAQPTTPLNQRKEVSAFSPYDTPSNFTPFTDLSYNACPSVKPKLHEPIYSDSKLDLIPMPLSTSRNASSIPDESVTCDDESQVYTDADPFEMSDDDDIHTSHPWLTRSLTNSTTWSKYESRRSAVQPSPTENVAIQTKYRKLDRNISSITKAIDDFPNNMLRLDSPAILALRKCPTQQADQQLIGALEVVFPQISKQLLSALAAWVIVDSYFLDIEKHRPESTASMNRSFSARVFALPSSKQIQQNLTKTSSSCTSPPPTHQRLPSRSTTFPIPFDETLHSIPSKARTVLGIDSDINIRLLLSQAKALQTSINVIAQRLLETIRGSENNSGPDSKPNSTSWDPALWRAITKIVQLIDNPISTKSQCISGTRAETVPKTIDDVEDNDDNEITITGTAATIIKGTANLAISPNMTERQRRQNHYQHQPIRTTSDIEKRFGFGNDSDHHLHALRSVQTWL